MFVSKPNILYLPLRRHAIVYRVRPGDWRPLPMPAFPIDSDPLTVALVLYDRKGGITPADGPILWASADPAVATVLGGPGATASIALHRPGSTTITATCGPITATGALEVRAGTPTRGELVFRLNPATNSP
jgi:hypothetical protein